MTEFENTSSSPQPTPISPPPANYQSASSVVPSSTSPISLPSKHTLPSSPSQDLAAEVDVTKADMAPHAAFPDARGRERTTRLVELAVTTGVWLSIGVVIVLVGVFIWWPLAVLLVAIQLLSVVVSMFRSLSGVKRLLARDDIHPVSFRSQPVLWRLIEEVALRSGVEPPPTYIMENKSINAFAAPVGLKKRVMVLHTGWLENSSVSQTRGVLAHELAHIKNNDSLVSLILSSSLVHMSSAGAASQRRAGSYHKASPTSEFLTSLGSLLGVIARLLSYTTSRAQERQADLTAARSLGGAGSMLDCLRHLEQSHNNSVQADVPHRFRTHPPTKARIEFLRDMCSRQASRLPPG